jgi:Uma2 family endonuclease
MERSAEPWEDSFMSVVAEKLTRDTFREIYAQRKPHYELLDGVASQKSVPTRLHSILQFILSVTLKELGFKSRPELTLAIDQDWEPTPDVCGILGPEEDPYPTHAIAVAIEVLSPDDRFTRVLQKCRKYSQWGIQDILVYDPVGRDVWYWDPVAGGLLASQGSYRFRSRPVELLHNEVFRRLDDELRQS